MPIIQLAYGQSVFWTFEIYPAIFRYPPGATLPESVYAGPAGR